MMSSTRDVLDRLLAEVLEGEVELAQHLVVDLARDADPAGRGQSLEAGGDVDAVAVDVVVLDDHVTEVDADAERDPLAVRHPVIALGHGALNLDRALDSVDHARELDQRAVAHQLYRAAAARCDRRLEQLAAVGFQAGERTGLVRAHEARVAGHIGGEDRRKSAVHGHGATALQVIAQGIGGAYILSRPARP
jgi:hypothetical protein